MINRYRVALAKGRAEYEKLLREDTELLEAFGLQLLSVDGGLRAVVEAQIKDRVNPWDVMTIDFKTWVWLKPLLAELRERQDEEAGEVILAAAN